ncbi:MAG: DUF4238 domain-containing protein, partial [Dokdonella sp.]
FGDNSKIIIIENTFASPEGVVTAVRNACGKRYLYTPLNDDGTRDRRVDEWLDKLESVCAAMWREIYSDPAILFSAGLRHGIAMFIAAMYLRNLAFFNLVDSTITIRNKLYGAPTPEKNLARPSSRYDLLNTGKAFQKFFLDGIDKATNVFFEKKWAVIFSENNSFITSDRPVSVADGSNPKAGPHTNTAVTVFPVNQKVALIIGDNVEASGFPLLATASMIASTNKLISMGSQRFLVCGRPASDVIAEIQSAS